MTLTEQIAAGLAAMHVAVPTEAAGRMAAHLELIAKWNRVHNLTAIREPERMLTHHVLDALAVLPHLPDAAARPDLRLLDVGSGGGVPAIESGLAQPIARGAAKARN